MQDAQLRANPNADYNLLRGQFLNSELTDTCTPLDANFSSQWGPSSRGLIHKERIFLSGVILQINDIADISKSLLQQIDIANGVLLEEAFEKGLEDEAKPPDAPTKHPKFKPKAEDDPRPAAGTLPASRTLRFVLSDGQLECWGSSTARSQASPAARRWVRLKNVTVLRGHMLLGKNNCEVLGGSVPERNTLSFVSLLEGKLNQRRASAGPDSAANQTSNPKRSATLPLGQSKKTTCPADPPASNPFVNPLGLSRSTPTSAHAPKPFSQPTCANVVELEGLSDLFDDSALFYFDSFSKGVPAEINLARPTPTDPPGIAAVPSATPATNPTNMIVLNDSIVLSDWDDDDDFL
ncbi:hypothetical protein L0F63_004855 [Massospora cicadina]|nr:hypothetical protein L0F63_004855 [Massospora cicadina]